MSKFLPERRTTRPLWKIHCEAIYALAQNLSQTHHRKRINKFKTNKQILESEAIVKCMYIFHGEESFTELSETHYLPQYMSERKLTENRPKGPGTSKCKDKRSKKSRAARLHHQVACSQNDTGG